MPNVSFVVGPLCFAQSRLLCGGSLLFFFLAQGTLASHTDFPIEFFFFSKSETGKSLFFLGVAFVRHVQVVPLPVTLYCTDTLFKSSPHVS